MSSFELHILGCGSALPTRRHLPSAQVLVAKGKQFLIDCGEGTQLQFRHTHLNFNKIQAIFISHLHGDHCFGLIGLISTMGLLGRHAPLYIYSPAQLEGLMRPQLDFYCKELTFDVHFVGFDPYKHTCIFEDRTLEVFTIPLKHRIPCAGFLFREKPKERHILKEWLDKYEVPLRAIPALKAGEDYVTPDGLCIPNSSLTSASSPPKSYAYVSDTAYHPSIIPMIQGVDVLYHEATFANDEADKAVMTFHSTAEQAGKIARDAHVKRLLIGHFSARYTDESCLLEEARKEFEAVWLAQEGMKIEL
jgi:ribonuclease Z